MIYSNEWFSKDSLSFLAKEKPYKPVEGLDDIPSLKFDVQTSDIISASMSAEIQQILNSLSSLKNSKQFQKEINKISKKLKATINEDIYSSDTVIDY